MDNKETIIKFNAAFEKSDTNDIVNYITEDFEWHMLGETVTKGRADFVKFFADNADMKIVSVTKDHIIVDGDTASVNGEMQCSDKSGKIYDMYYCDIYELEKGLIKKMVSYVLNKKKA